MLASTRSATGLSSAMCSRFSDSTSCWTSHNLSRSNPVSYSPPSSAAMTLSAAGWEVPQANGDMATSSMSAPASTAAMYAIGAIPLEQCECTLIGTLTACLRAVTSSHVAWGLSSPDVSLMTMSWTPMSTNPLASEHQSSMLWAGETA